MENYFNKMMERRGEISYLNILVCDSLDVSISDFFIPDLQRFGANAVQYTEKSTLKSILKHFFWKIQQNITAGRKERGELQSIEMLLSDYSDMSD